MEQNKEVTIPQSVQDICRAIAKVAQEQGLHQLSGKFRPPYDVWGADVSFSWEEGRHGEDMNMLSITSTVWINTKVNM